MDELTLLRNFHRDTPGPSPAETAAARARLLAAIDDPHCTAARVRAPRRRPPVLGHLPRSRLWAPMSAAAAVTAVAVTAAVIAVPGSRTAPGSTGSPPTAASALNEAASAAARQSAGHGRYFFVQSESVSSTGQPQLQENWSGDGVPGRRVIGGYDSASPAAMSPNGRVFFGDRALTWSQVQHLPTAPSTLLAEIARGQTTSLQPQEKATWEFSVIESMLVGAPVPPAVRSALYRAAAMLPGMRVIAHTHDLIGRPASEVYSNSGNGLGFGPVLFFDPATGTALGNAAFIGSCPATDMELAVLASGYVSSTHQLPAGAKRNARPAEQPDHNCPRPPRNPKPSPSPGPLNPNPSPSVAPKGYPSPTP